MPENADLTAELIEHAVRSIEDADYFALPFPHIFFRDFFPKAIYPKLIESVPTNGFDNIKSNGTRTALRLYGDNIERIEPEVRELWAAVSAMLTSAEVERAIRAKLHDGLEIRARGDKVAGAKKLRLVAKPVVYRDRDGYEIKPHPDTRKKVVTMQLYCPADDRQKDLGTTLYRASVKGLLHPKSYGLEPIKTLPFLPNVGYAFVVLKAYHTIRQMSWHGRPKISAPIDRPRISILNTFYADESLGF
ncbi:MAG TPA: hypothetical protein VFJ18_09585 [Pararhizobium sp.]|nr:hypothetical protein [Pararhizobium sp.]